MMNGYESYNGGYDEKRHGHGHVDDDAFGPKTGSSIVSAFDAFRM